MNARIKVDDLPEFDGAPYLDGEVAIAAYLTDILGGGRRRLIGGGAR